jgi:hypothetical protein
MAAGSFPGSVAVTGAGTTALLPLLFTVRSAVGVLAAPVTVPITLTPDSPASGAFLLVMTAQAYLLTYNVTVGRQCDLPVALGQSASSVLPFAAQQTIEAWALPAPWLNYGLNASRAPYLCSLVVATDAGGAARSVVQLAVSTAPGTANASQTSMGVEQPLVAGALENAAFVQTRDRLGNVCAAPAPVQAAVWGANGTRVLTLAGEPQADGTQRLRVGALDAGSYLLEATLGGAPLRNSPLPLDVAPVACPASASPDPAAGGASCACRPGRTGPSCAPCSTTPHRWSPSMKTAAGCTW